MKENKSILLFEINDVLLEARLHHILDPLRIRIRKVSPADYNRTIGELAGILPATNISPLPHPGHLAEPMIIFCGIPSEELDSLLAQFRRSAVNIPLKAVYTPYNQNWTPIRLFLELSRERSAITNKDNT